MTYGQCLPKTIFDKLDAADSRSGERTALELHPPIGKSDPANRAYGGTSRLVGDGARDDHRFCLDRPLGFAVQWTIALRSMAAVRRRQCILADVSCRSAHRAIDQSGIRILICLVTITKNPCVVTGSRTHNLIQPLIAGHQPLFHCSFSFLFGTLIYNWTETGMGSLHPVWFTFFVLAMDYPRPQPIAVCEMPEPGYAGLETPLRSAGGRA